MRRIHITFVAIAAVFLFVQVIGSSAANEDLAAKFRPIVAQLKEQLQYVKIRVGDNVNTKTVVIKTAVNSAKAEADKAISDVKSLIGKLKLYTSNALSIACLNRESGIVNQIDPSPILNCTPVSELNLVSSQQIALSNLGPQLDITIKTCQTLNPDESDRADLGTCLSVQVKKISAKMGEIEGDINVRLSSAIQSTKQCAAGIVVPIQTKVNASTNRAKSC